MVTFSHGGNPNKKVGRVTLMWRCFDVATQYFEEILLQKRVDRAH